MAETPNLGRLNENADTITYTDNALTRSPLYFSIDTTGTATSNLNDSFSNQPVASGFYFDIGAPIGIHLATPVSDFGAYFRADTSFYPGHTDLNHTSEVYSHLLTHQFSDTTTASWSVAGGHVVTLGHYLSPVIGIGTTGVVATTEASGLAPLTDAATTLSMSHQFSERDSLSTAVTGGWLDQPTLAGAARGGSISNRQATGGGDMQWQHALNSRELAGIEFTNVYVAGLTPVGMSNFSSVKLTFGQTLTPHSSFTGGIGPLYTHSALTGTQDQNNFSYTANAGVDYRRSFGRITAGYSRVYVVGYLAPTSVANQLYLTFDRPLSSRLFLSADAQLLQSSAQQSGTSYSTFGFTSRLDMYMAHSLAYNISGSSFIQGTGAEEPGYRDNEVSFGVTYYFRSPLSRAGAQ
ncbi:MAG TPA: hypothetical protein VFW25_02245 [Silvibacterium sp.]|nr:hypothetical protein [Silvibacterium sp.]